MKVAIWDTYVTKKDGSVIHFNIIVPQAIKDNHIIYGYGKSYLKSKAQQGQSLTSIECEVCHIAKVRLQWEIEIKKATLLLKWKIANENKFCLYLLLK
ncbi:MAG TPA: DUF2024 family protein [Chitinophagaceae bacterium]|nr:MAG: hypothetical protein UZ11_BCD004002051 [Bacteroidetes bacterium OLB11]HMN32538.1 DUF2024 family protein [Chitinophagaceae bacterium]